MALETASFINGLVTTNPTASDPKSEGDDHIRLLKSTIKATFPNVTGAVTPNQTELNYVAGVTSAIQTQINALAAKDLTLFQTITPTNGVNAINITGIPVSRQIIVVLQDVASTASGQIQISLSANAGTNLSAVQAISIGTINSGVAVVWPPNASTQKSVFSGGTGATGLLFSNHSTTSGPVNYIRLTTTGGTFNGAGTIYVYTVA